MSLAYLNNANVVLFYVYSNLNNLLPIVFYVFTYVFSFSLKISNFFFIYINGAELCNPHGFVDCPVTVLLALC